MKRIVYLIVYFVLVLQMITPVQAAPWEVLSDISYMRKGGVDAVRIDFALPVLYVSHLPVKHGKTLTINIRFSQSANIDTSDGEKKPTTEPSAPDNSQEQIDISELPLLQTMNAPESMLIPLQHVTYMLENNQPKLVVEFSEDVNFSVSQVMGINSLIIFLPTTAKPDAVDPEIQPIEQEIVEVQKSATTEDEEKIKQMLDEGRTALKRGDNKKAIQIFTKLLSMSDHAYLPASLEFLGVARERNNQAAQAKAMYEQYLKQYPKGDGAIRVNQRLADLISSRSQPKKKLKETDTTKEEKKPYTYELYGSFAQYMDYSATATEDLPRETDSAILSNQLLLNQRYRTKTLDVRNYFFANYDVDTVNGESDGIEIGQLNSKINFKNLGLNMTVGRQSASTAGILGKFDGVSVGYQVMEKIRVNGTYGYPYSYIDKQHVQTSKPFYGASVEFNEIWEGWDISPYMFRQTADGVVDRTAVGTEVRYFKNEVSVFGLLDYDIYFGDLNIFMVNGTYNFKERTAMTFNFDHRKSPTLESSNALLQLSADAKLDQLSSTYGLSDEEIKSKTKDRTGSSSSISIGLSHEYSDKLSVASDISYYRYTSATINVTQTSPTDLDVLNTPSTKDQDKQWDYSAQVVRRAWFIDRDTSIGYIRFSNADDYNEVTYSAAYRRPFGTQWRTNLQVQVRDRNNTNSDDLVKIIPSLKVDNRVGKDVQLYLETSIEIWRFKGNDPTGAPDAKSYNVYFGYNWNF